jgi:hypothetical protein
MIDSPIGTQGCAWPSVLWLLMVSSELWQGCDIPPAADRLDQQRACVHPPQQDVDGVQFVGQRNGLGGDD